MTERDNRLQIFYAISIALHLLAFQAFLGPFLSSLELPDLPPRIEIVELPASFRSPTLRAPAPVTPPPAALEKAAPPEARPVPQPPPRRAHDVVSIPRPAVEQAPRDDRFLAEYSQRVERPARARDRPIDTRGEISKQKTADPLAKPAEKQTDRRGSEAREAREAREAQARVVAGGGAGTERAGAAGNAGPPVPVSADAIFRKKTAGAGATSAPATGPRGPGAGLKDLIPREARLAQLEAAASGGRSNPYNPDLVPADAEMSMDTLRYEHTGYYLAVKKRVELNWDPARLIRSADDTYQQTLRNFGGNSMLSQGAGSAVAEAAARTGRGTTVMRITINKNGRLASDPQMLQSSGSAFLDEEALRALRFGDPFPPVPDRLAKKSLTITWSFTFGRKRP